MAVSLAGVSAGENLSCSAASTLVETVTMVSRASISPDGVATLTPAPPQSIAVAGVERRTG